MTCVRFPVAALGGRKNIIAKPSVVRNREIIASAWEDDKKYFHRCQILLQSLLLLPQMSVLEFSCEGETFLSSGNCIEDIL